MNIYMKKMFYFNARRDSCIFVCFYHKLVIVKMVPKMLSIVVKILRTKPALSLHNHCYNEYYKDKFSKKEGEKMRKYGIWLVLFVCVAFLVGYSVTTVLGKEGSESRSERSVCNDTKRL